MGARCTNIVFLGKVMLFLLFLGLLFSGTAYAAEKPIVFGVPTALGAIEGRDGWMAIQMAVEEINAKGGVMVGGEKRPLEAYSIDTREHEPGIPVHDALTAVEKLVLEKKPHAIVLGNFRSEVLLASMDLISKYKLPYICSIAMTPAYQKKIVEQYDKYKYCFRNCLNAISREGIRFQ
jgi:branched-chain amino acid transport system substrate-binding protein